MEVFQGLPKPPARLECDHCGFQGADHESVQIHAGTAHPELCDEMDAGGLGRMIFYQKSAKLFHCHRCFFTSKMYSSVYHHITAAHAAPGSWGETPKGQLSREADATRSPPLPERQASPSSAAEPRPAPSLPPETRKPGPALSPESPRPAPLASLEPQRPGPAGPPEPPAPLSSPEPLRPTPASPEPSKPALVAAAPPAPEAQKLVPASPDPVRAALGSPKPQKHAHLPEALGSPSAPSPESPVLATPPDSWGPSPSASPEPRRPARPLSPEPRKPAPSGSPEPCWKPFPAAAPEPRRPAPAVSPGSWRPGPPGSPRSWKSSPAACSGPWKPAKPAPSVSPGPWRPIPSASPAPWKSPPVGPGSWKTPPASPEPWKPGPPELRKAVPALSPEPWKAVPPVSPELRKAGPPVSPEVRGPAGSPEPRKPPGSPETWKLSPDPRKTPPAAPDFPEPQRSPRGGPPDLWEASLFAGPQKPALPDARKAGPAEGPRAASDAWKPVLPLDAEPRKPALFPEPPRAGPPAAPEPRRRSLFPEPRKHPLFPELPRSPVLAESQKAAGPGDELQAAAAADPRGDRSAQEELPAGPRRLSEDALLHAAKRLKKDGPEGAGADADPEPEPEPELEPGGGGPLGKAEADAPDARGQESGSDQEQVDVESLDFGREGRLDAAGSERARSVVQFTEEKEAFISEEEIAKYMKRGKGKYYCKICCCRAMKKGAVLHHLVNKHNVHSPYKCAICGKAFLLEALLKNHVAAHGQSLLRCPRCSFESNFPRGFKKHLTHCQSRHGEEASRKLVEALEPPAEGPQV